MLIKIIAILTIALASIRLVCWILGIICRRRCRAKYGDRIMGPDYCVNMDDTEPVDDSTKDLE